jgi:hypothetical protein
MCGTASRLAAGQQTYQQHNLQQPPDVSMAVLVRLELPFEQMSVSEACFTGLHAIHSHHGVVDPVGNID